MRLEGGSGINLRFGFFNHSNNSIKQLIDLLPNIENKISKIYKFENAKDGIISMGEEKHFGKIIVQIT